MEQSFIKFINGIKNKPNTYVVLGGDLLDNCTRTSVGSVFSQTMSPSQQKMEMVNILKPIKDRILCIIPGNHELRSEKDGNCQLVWDIAAILGIEHLYRDNIAFMNIQLGSQTNKSGSRKSGSIRPSYNCVIAHGSGGGVLPGSFVNKSTNFGYYIDGLDLILVGHCHKPFNITPAKIQMDVRNKRVSFKPFEVVCASSWLTWAGYAARGMMPPTSYCEQTITLCANKKKIIYQKSAVI